MSLSSEAFDSTVEIMFNTNSTDNGTNLANTSHLGVAGSPFENFFKVAFGLSIFVSIASFIIISANTLLLLTFFIDPLKIFRNPTTYYLIGLAIVDLLTGLVQEPIYATCFIIPSIRGCYPLMKFAAYFASCSITISLIIVFAFTVTQYIVVASPLKYGRLVTKKKVLVTVMSIYIYTAVFSCLPLMGVPQKVYDSIELFLHNYALVLVTIAFYILLHYTMKRKMAAANSLKNETTSAREGCKHTRVQRNFVRLNVIFIVVLIVCFLPGAIIMTIRMYMEDEYAASSEKVHIANLMTDNLLYLKFLLDPFV